MFDQYYGFSGRPFQLTPDPKFYFESITHRKALSYLGYGMAQGEGFIVITPTPSATDDPTSGDDPTSDNETSDSGSPSAVESQTITNTSSTQSGTAPLVQNSGNNGNLVTATLPPGVSIASEGSAEAQSSEQAQQSLTQSIQNGNTTPDTEQSLIQRAQNFLDSLPQDNKVDVRSIIPTTTSASQGQPIVITGSSSPTSSDDSGTDSDSSSSANTSQTEAFVIDLTEMPAAAGTQLELHNIDLAVIIGPAVITGGSGSNIVHADDHPQSIILGADDDTLDGGGGNDTIGSAAGDDLLIGARGRDLITGGADNDTLKGGPQADSLIGGSGDDLLTGGQGSDTLKGAYGNDILKGQQYQDLLQGGYGDDTLFGGKGKDILKGGEGADTFRLSKGKDTIKDFSIIDGDVIDAPNKLDLRLIQRGNHLLLKDNEHNIKTTLLNINQIELLQHQPGLI